MADALIVNLDLPGGGFFMPLFVTLADGRVLDDAIRRGKICDRLRAEYTPRHVPDRIIQVQAIPATLTGKKMEVPVRKLLLGVPVGAGGQRQRDGQPGLTGGVRRLRPHPAGLLARLRRPRPADRTGPTARARRRGPGRTGRKGAAVPHALTELKLTAVTKPAADPGHEIRADVCVVGAEMQACRRPSSRPSWAGMWCCWTRSR